MCSHIVLPYPDYHIDISHKASKSIEDLPQEDQLVIIKKIDALTSNNALSLDIKKLHGYEHLYRIRHDHYRIVFSVDEATKNISIILVGHRREIYNLVKKLSHLIAN